MFSAKKKDGMRDAESVDSIIGKGTFFKGNLNAQGSIRIDGNFEGEITVEGDAWIGEDSQVRARIKAHNIVLAGTVWGDLDVTDKLEIASAGKLYGNVVISRLVIGEGAVFQGASEMRQDVATDAAVSTK